MPDIAIGDVASFPIGQMRIVQAGPMEIGVIRQIDGRLRAVRNRCPHRGAPVCLGTLGGTMMPSAPGELEYGLDRNVVRCPWHGYEFDLETGQGLFANADWKLRTFPVIVRDGIAYVTNVPTRAQSGGIEP